MIAVFVLAAVLLVAGSLLLAAALRLRGFASWLMAAALLALAQLVLVAEVLTPFAAVGRAEWLLGEVIVLLAAGVAWLARGRAGPDLPKRPGRGEIVTAVRAHPVVAIAVGVAVPAVLLQLAVGVGTAPDHWDSMTYHLSRAAYWLQHGSLESFSGESVRQLASAPNAEIALAWTMAMRGTDGLATLVQWCALLGSAGAVWMIVRELGLARSAAAFAAAIWVMVPEAIVQATTTQNDLTVCWLVLAAIAFALRGLRRGGVTELALAGLAFGLALGTKGSVVYALPALALVVAGASWRLRPAPRLVGVLLGCAVAGAVAFASFAYIQNTVVTGSPSGGLTGLGQRTEALVPNEVHAAWSFVDAPGVSFDWADRVFAHTLAHVPHWSTPSFAFVVDTSTGEDTMAAGLVGLLVLFPLVLWAGFGRRREPVARALALGSLIYVVFFGATYVADAFAGRVLLVARRSPPRCSPTPRGPGGRRARPSCSR
jgi:hypothetical protein